MSRKRYWSLIVPCCCAIASALSISQTAETIKRPQIDMEKRLSYPTPKGSKPSSRGQVRPPAGIIPTNEGFRSIGFRFLPSPDDAYVARYTWGIGGLNPKDPNYPGELTELGWVDIKIHGDFIYGKSLDELNEICDRKGLPRLKIGDKVKLCVRADAASGYQDNSEMLVVDYTITNPPLGESGNNLTFTFGNKYDAPVWDWTEQSNTTQFLNAMLPILKELYGPPAHSNSIGLKNDKNQVGSNVFMADPNEIWMLGFDPQLLTHEFVHAMRDYACLSSNAYWHQDSWLMAFEEGFAQSVSYWAMNKFADKYPQDPIWGTDSKNILYFRPNHGETYDFDNLDVVTTKDYWSGGNSDATGMGRRRYELGAMAMHKIFMEDKDNAFPKHFNSEYYKTLSSNPKFIPTRENLIEMVAKVLTTYGKSGAKIEGRPVKDWFNRQRIFDCRVKTGNKIFNNSYNYPTTSGTGTYYRGRVYYYETFSDGLEWSTTINGQHKYHKTNGAVGYSKLSDWTGKTLAKNITQTLPIEQPELDKGMEGTGWVMASYKLDATTVSFDQYLKWPKGEACNYLPLKTYGLYTLEHHLEHPAGLPVTSRQYFLGGEGMEDSQLSGAVIDDDNKIGEKVSYKNGKIYFKHSANTTEDGPYEVKNGVFLAKPQWVGVNDPFNKGKKICKPGIVKIRFINSETNEESHEFRNINYGDWNGSNSFLFREKDMLDKNDNQKPNLSIESDPLKGDFNLEQNYPNPFNPQTTISFNLPQAGEVNLSIYNSRGEEVTTLHQGQLSQGRHSFKFNGAQLASGLYFYKLSSASSSVVKKMVLLK